VPHSYPVNPINARHLVRPVSDQNKRNHRNLGSENMWSLHQVRSPCRGRWTGTPTPYDDGTH